MSIDIVPSKGNGGLRRLVRNTLESLEFYKFLTCLKNPRPWQGVFNNTRPSASTRFTRWKKHSSSQAKYSTHPTSALSELITPQQEAAPAPRSPLVLLRRLRIGRAADPRQTFSIVGRLAHFYPWLSRQFRFYYKRRNFLTGSFFKFRFITFAFC